jgi:hypothetical protein
MNGFQIVFGTLALLAGARLIWLGLRGRTSWLGAYFWGLLWIAAAFAIFKPEITSEFAVALGITRGADLVMYLAVLAGIVVTRYFYNRYRRLETTLTAIVRDRAIKDAEDLLYQRGSGH